MNYQNQLGNYLNKLGTRIGEHNTKLIREFNARHTALPDEPCSKRPYTFPQILNNNLDDKINAHLDIIKKDIQIKMMEINQSITQTITNPSR